MTVLPLESDVEEAVNLWERARGVARHRPLRPRSTPNVGRPLALNAEAVKVTQGRGADALEVARTRFNDYGPLLQTAPLQRRPHPAAELPGRLRGRASHRDAGQRLRCPCRLGRQDRRPGPQPCVSRRSRWATIIRPASPKAAPPATTTWPTTSSARAPTRLRSWPTAWPRPPSACRCSPVDCLPRVRRPGDLGPALRAAHFRRRGQARGGHRGRALPGICSQRLPRTAPDGDAAIAAVWQMVADEKRRRDEEKSETRRGAGRGPRGRPGGVRAGGRRVRRRRTRGAERRCPRRKPPPWKAAPCRMPV